ncbi:Multifunctional chaperone (14-3-3 family) protein [Pseudoloma neurophilia]|uniref:Multifunctional chaperone (14-3-3 family) protein n=1 Tax=Pseudoloma neurophilia TaxID=146866 RepID=A0A0R0LS87_9MICR|nr:Multifunctional chaperone (14-3-3 family) protein [Pseudoloma neurophilia]
MATNNDPKLEILLVRCALLERSERYAQLVPIVKDLLAHCSQTNFLNHKIRNYFSVAYKHITGSLRSAWRSLIIEKEKYKDRDVQEFRIVEEYLREIETELNNICDDVIDQIDKHILSRPDDDNAMLDADSKVYFLKMQADYFRYKAEVTTGQNFELFKNKSKNAYESAMECAKTLPSVNSLRLGLALNFSVFYYEIEKSPEKACLLAKQAFDDSIKDIDAMAEDHYKDSTLIMQLLRDNLSLWSHREGNKEEMS